MTNRMADHEPKLVERVFGAEENSAAKIGAEKLSKYHGIADKMFNTNVLRTRELFYPALASFAGSVIGGVATYRTLFFVNIFKLDMVYVASILALISIYDVINDPLMGIAYDKTRTRWGKSRPYLLFTPIPYFFSTAILYCGAILIRNDNTSDPKKVIFVFVTLFIQETFSTIYNIPKGNLLTLMTPNPDDRIKSNLINSYVDGFGRQIVYGLFMPLQDLNRWGVTNISLPAIFAFMGLFAAAVGSVGNIMMAMNVRERVILQRKPAPTSKTIFYILKNKYALRNFIAGFSVNWWTNGGYSWDVVTQLEIIGGAFKSALVYSGFNILEPVSLVFVPKVMKWFGNDKRKGVLTFRAIDIVRTVLQCIIGIRYIDRPWIFGLSFFFFWSLNALDNAPSSVLESEMGREINDYTEYVTGERPDGTFGLLTNLIGRVTAPLNALLTILVFRWTGYDATIPMGPWSQGNKVVYQKIYFLYTAVGVLPHLIQTIPVIFYDLVGKKREQMYIELNERRALLAKQHRDEDEISEEMQAVIDMLAEEEKQKG
ncbi:MAG: Inner membrane symporter YicJ [Firmicutes bacterium ADurb.Bin262]|nr:MAG: Inner membrane symporter YicJ [Firmicutes bacterium ADurb.Bin262]